MQVPMGILPIGQIATSILSRIRHALDDLPETLDETYERTLLDIDKELLFQCLVVALHPLSVEELADFLAFEFDDGESPIFQADCRPEERRCSAYALVLLPSSMIMVAISYNSRTFLSRNT